MTLRICTRALKLNLVKSLLKCIWSLQSASVFRVAYPFSMWSFVCILWHLTFSISYSCYDFIKRLSNLMNIYRIGQLHLWDYQFFCISLLQFGKCLDKVCTITEKKGKIILVFQLIMMSFQLRIKSSSIRLLLLQEWQFFSFSQ